MSVCNEVNDLQIFYGTCLLPATANNSWETDDPERSREFNKSLNSLRGREREMFFCYWLAGRNESYGHHFVSGTLSGGS